jgi:hypothetical protein
MFTVLGSGFGLYGYLPALLESFPDDVVMPEVSRERIAARSELTPYVPRVRFVANRDAALALADGAVIATPPAAQPDLVAECLAQPRLRTLVLEKPLAVTPHDAQSLLAQVRGAGRRVRVGYTLLHAPWTEAFAWPHSGPPVEITWRFMAHHFAANLDNWKRHAQQGGGALRFFGVHLFPFLSRQGYDRVTASEISQDAVSWRATFTGPRVPECRIEVDSCSPGSCFDIAAGEAKLIQLADPFGPPHVAGSEDRRVAVLKRLFATFGEGDESWYGLYDAANELWMQAEK